MNVVRAGRPFRVTLEGKETKNGEKRALVIHPFLFRLAEGVTATSSPASDGSASGTPMDAVKIDWEHTEAHFTTDVRTELGALATAGETVPRLMETWLRVALDAASERELERAVVENRRDGAATVARLAVQALAACVARQADPAPFMRGADYVCALAYHYVVARPSMHCVKAAVATCVAEAAGAPDMPWAALVRRVQQTAAAVAARIDEAGAVAGARWLAGVPEGGAVLTLSASSTLRDCLASAAAQLKALRLFVCESRAAGEGAALAAALAAHAGNKHDITVIPDCAALPLLLTLCTSGTACHVVLGADAAYGDGSFTNKVGSHSLLLAAREAAALTAPDLVRVAVLFDRFKLSPASSCLCTPFVSEVDVAPQHAPSALVGVWNPTFEAVPASAFPRLEHYTDLPADAHGITPVDVLARFGREIGSYVDSITDISD